MKKLIIIIIAMLVLQQASATRREITAQEAVSLVCNQLASDIETEAPEISYGLTNDNEWLIMTDPTPYANWGHDVTFYYVPHEVTSGSPSISRIEKSQWLPKIPLTKVEGEPTPLSFQPFRPKNVKVRDVPENKRQYAVILSGGKNRYQNHWRYWNDCSYIYSVLRKFYNVPKENIFVAMSDGKDPELDNTLGNSQNLDLDEDGLDDIEYAATLDDLTLIFNALRDKMTKDDHLLFYVIDHGGYDERVSSSYICLWEQENEYPEESRLYPIHLDTWFSSLDVGSINCVFGQCYSGGFVKPLQAKNRIISTACKEDEYSYAHSDLHYDAFVDAWTTALMNESMYLSKPVIKADDDNDGFINTKEAFNFALKYDTMGPEGAKLESPQFNCGYDILAQDLCVDRHPAHVELIVRDSHSDVGIMPSKSESNESPDIWVRQAQDGGTIHQQPKFTMRGAVENYVYVRITNKSVFDYDPSKQKRYLHLNWAKGAPAHKYTTYSGQFNINPSEKEGGAIKSVLIDEFIESEDELIICVPWRTNGYPVELSGEPISILASISDQPYGLAYDVTRGYYSDISAKNPAVKSATHNNIAIKSQHCIHTGDQNGLNVPMFFQNLSTENKYYTVKAVSSLGGKLKIGIHLPEDVEIQVNVPSDGISQHLVIDETKDFYSDDGVLQLSYLPLSINDFKKLSLSGEVLDCNASGEFEITITIMEYPNSHISGTYKVLGKISNGSFVGNNSQILLTNLGSNTFMLTAIDESDTKQHSWIDNNGSALGSAESVMVEVLEPVIITLRSIDTTVNEECSTSITLEPQVFIVSATKNSGRTIDINLSASTSDKMSIILSSLMRPHIGVSKDVLPGEKFISFPVSGFDEDILVISLVQDGETKSYVIVK